MSLPLKWAYGVTTVPSRRSTLLKQTLASLALAGFPQPRLFVDGCSHGHAASYSHEFKVDVTSHEPPLRAYGNWCLALGELYIRQPLADLYALFQDDVVTVVNLRAYLERSLPPLTQVVQDQKAPPGHQEVAVKRYWNLYTFRENDEIIKGQKPGWHEGARFRADQGVHYHGRPGQKGRSATGLVLPRAGVMALLSHPYMVARPLDPVRGHLSIDGGVVTAMNQSGWTEMVHNPSLLQHLGHVSTIRTKKQAQASSFPGEATDALSFLA